MQQQDTKSWFKQFWPWFIVALPLTAVIASLYTVMIAFENQDSLVKSEYYKEGLAINEQLQEYRLAEELGLSGDISIAPETGQIHLSLASDQNAQLPNTLTLSFIHPVTDTQDFQIALVKTAEGQYQGSLNRALDHRWHLQLTPLATQDQATWKLQSSIDFNSGNTSKFLSKQ